MSCRHDLALGNCRRCYPETGTVDPGREPEYQRSLDGPGAVPARPRPFRPSDVQRRALLALARCGEQGVTCSNLGSELATSKYRRLPQTYARQGGRTLRGLEARGLVKVAHDGVHWNWSLTPRGVVERVRLSVVEGVFDASINLPQRWTCAGPCGKVREATGNQLLDEGWTFTSVGLANWGRCPRCQWDACPDLAGVAAQVGGRGV